MNKNDITPVQIAIRIVIIIIVLALLLIVSFAMVRFVPQAISSLGNIKNLFGVKERMELTLDKKTIAQDENASLSYRQSGGTSGGHYIFNYSCAHIDSNTRLEITQGDTNETVSCDEPYTLADATSTSLFQNISLHPTGEDVSYDQPIAITIGHTNGSSTLSLGSATLTVLGTTNQVTEDDDQDQDEATTTTSVVPTPAVSTPKPTPVYHSTTPADLSVRMGQVTVDKAGLTSVTFYVSNIGGQNSGSWNFSATLPRSVGQTTYNSSLQSSIPPGGTSTMHLSFGNAKAGNIVIYVDPSNQVQESSEGNNTTSATLR